MAGPALAYAKTRALIAAYEAAYGTIEPGTTARMNHDDCPAGADTRTRLYVTRKQADSGKLTDLAYCHNCGVGGAIVAGGPATIRTALRGVSTATAKAPLKLPQGLVPVGTGDWPEAAKNFLREIGTRMDHHTLGTGFDRESCRLILPAYSTVLGTGGQVTEVDALIGWQARRLWGSGPKYLTVEADGVGDAGIEMSFSLWDGLVDSVVLVEDWLSALHVATTCPGSFVVPMFRYKISAERLARLRRRHLNVPLIAWLDNDKTEVIAEAAHIRRLWGSLGGATSMHILNTDPKRYADVELIREYSNATAGL